MKITDLSRRILQGDFSFLSFFKSNKNASLHPAELAKVLASLPKDATLKALEQLSLQMQISVFA